jgi:lipopolysaccharide transport system ATP-binding protein
MARIPVALHAVSAGPFVPEWADPLMHAFMDSLDYAAVRDEGTLANLRRFARPGQEISLVADSVFSVSDFLHRGQPSPEYQALVEATGIGAKYLVLQPTPILRRNMNSVFELAKAARDRGWELLELPIFNEKLNYAGFFGDLPGLRRIREWPNPLLLAEVIANAQAVVGHSLHLSIVASAYGVPVYRTRFADTSKFILLNRFPNIHFLGDGQPLRGWSDAEQDMSVATEVKTQLQDHWRRLAETARPPGSGTYARGWEQLCVTPQKFRRDRGAADTWREVTDDLTHRRQLMLSHLRRNFAETFR